MQRPPRVSLYPSRSPSASPLHLPAVSRCPLPFSSRHPSVVRCASLVLPGNGPSPLHLVRICLPSAYWLSPSFLCLLLCCRLTILSVLPLKWPTFMYFSRLEQLMQCAPDTHKVQHLVLKEAYGPHSQQESPPTPSSCARSVMSSIWSIPPLIRSLFLFRRAAASVPPSWWPVPSVGMDSSYAFLVSDFLFRWDPWWAAFSHDFPPLPFCRRKIKNLFLER